MELSEVLAALRAAWWLSVLGLLLGGGIAMAASLAQTPQYTSETQLFVSTRNAGTTSDAFTGSQFSQERVTSYARLIAGEEVAARVVGLLDLDVSPAALSERIAASAVPETVLIDVAVTDESPERAARIANAVGVVFTDFVDELETFEAGGPSLVEVAVTNRPGIPSSPSSPDTLRLTAIGILIGLIVGASIAVLRAQLDRTVKEPEESMELVGAPVIGLVVRDEALGKLHTIDRIGGGRSVEDYRQLRTNLQFLNVDDPPRVIMVSSAMPSEGKTTATINLALALAEAGRQVTILDADLRRPRVTNYLGMVGGVGLTNVLAGTAEAADVLQTYGGTGVQVIGAGPTPPNPSELLASKHMSALIAELREKSEYVLIDAPPLLPVADSTGLAVMVDGVLLSVRYGKSRKDQLQQAASILERVGARTLGLILNIVPPKSAVTGAYGHGYTYAEPDQKKGGRRRAP